MLVIPEAVGVVAEQWQFWCGQLRYSSYFLTFILARTTRQHKTGGCSNSFYDKG